MKKVSIRQLDDRERIRLLEEASDLINEAIRLIREAVEDTELEDECEYYIIGHLEDWANSTRESTSIPKLIRRIERGGLEEDEDEF